MALTDTVGCPLGRKGPSQLVHAGLGGAVDPTGRLLLMIMADIDETLISEPLIPKAIMALPPPGIC